MNSNVNISNTYITMQKYPNNQFVFLGSDNLSQSEAQIIRKFIIYAVSKYNEYTDIAANIQDNCTNTFGGIWIAIVGERDKYNYFAYLKKSYRVNIGPYKISVINC